MTGNSKQIKRQRGYEGRFLTASLVCGFDFLNFFHRLIALHRILDEQVIKANDVIKFNDDSKKATDALNKILDDTTDEDEMEQFIEYFEKKEEYELRHFYELNHFLEKVEKEQYEISQCVETLNRIEETEQIKEFCNDVEKLSRVAYETDLLEKEKQIKKIDNELQLDVIAGKITPINLSSNGMTFDFVEFYNWAVSKGHELPPDINAYLTMSLNEFDEWCIKNNYSPPKRFAIARSKASQRVIIKDSVASIETTEKTRLSIAPVFSKFKDIRANEVSLFMLRDGSAKMVIQGNKIKISPSDLGLQVGSQGWDLLKKACANSGDFTQALRSKNKSTDLIKEKQRIKKIIFDLNKKLKESMGLKVNPINYLKGIGYKSTFIMLDEDIDGSLVTRSSDALDHISYNEVNEDRFSNDDDFDDDDNNGLWPEDAYS